MTGESAHEPTPGSHRAAETGLGRRITRGVAWTGLGAASVGSFDLLAMVALLRFWVSPRELGTATLAMALFPVLDAVADCGLSAALIQRGEPDRARSSTVFWLGLAVTSALVGALALLGPALARAQDEPLLGALLLGYGLKLLLMNLWAVPLALMRREMRFREISVIRVAAALADAATKIAVAAAGEPVWCFVAGSQAYAVVFAAGVQIRHPFRPALSFSSGEARACLRFGLRASASQILFQLYANLDYQVVGRCFGQAALGLYRVAADLVLLPVRFVSDIVVSVAFPAFSRLRADRAELQAAFVRFTRQSLALNLPVLATIFVAAEDAIMVFFPSYAGAATVARMLCVVGVLRLLASVFPPLLDGLGRPGLTLAYALVLATLLPSSYVVAAEALGGRIGALSVAFGWAFGFPIAFAVLVRLGCGAAGIATRAYAGRVAGMLACGLAGAGAALAVRSAAGDLGPAPRLGVSAAVALGSTALLLHFWQGIEFRAACSALKS